MPSEQRRRKDDTWTSEELHKALKVGSKDNMLRKKRDDGAQRRHHDDVNGSDRKRDQDGRPYRKDEDDKKSRRHKDRGDSPDNLVLSEDDRERLRQERRARREGGKEEKKTRPKESKSVKIIDEAVVDVRKVRRTDKDDDRHSEKKLSRREASQKRGDDREGERRKHKEDIDGEHRHHRDTNAHTTKQHHKEGSSMSRRHHDDTEQQRHHKEDSTTSRRHHDDTDQQRRHKENKGRKQITEEESRHHSRKSKDDDDEDRERRRQERREKREQEKIKDKDKNGEKGHTQHEKSERDHKSSRHNTEIASNRRVHHSRDRYSDINYKERDESEQEFGKSSSRREREQEPEKRSSRHRDIERELEKPSRRHHEDSARVSSPQTAHVKSESKKLESDEDDDYNYEEDFEDYDDDFEEDEDAPTKEENEMEGVLRALDDENNKLVKTSHRSNRSYSPQPSHENFREDNSVPRAATTKPTSFINFVSAKQRVMDQALAGKSLKRFDDLSRLIELDVVTYDMFDLQPVKEYEMYIRSFGRSDTKQAYVQTRDDDIDRDIQTEEIETLNKWTQHPSNDETAVGGEGINVQGSEHKQEVASKTDVVRLSQFLDRVSQMMLTILDEESQSSLEEVRKRDGKPAVSFCNNASQLSMPNFLTGRTIIALSFCQGEPNYLLSVHSTSVSDSENQQSPLQSMFVICVWNLSQPAYPYRICVSQMRITCACFSPVKASLVFAGMHDGSVALWDLREPSSDHRNIKVDGKEHLVRFPTYNTAGVMEPENHHSSVVSIVPVYSSIVGSEKDEEVTESSSGLSFQVASVEEKAVVNLWVVAEVTVSDPAGSETDLGLSPGGKIKLLRSSCIILSNPDKYLSTTLELRALNFHLDPSDLNHFYVGTDTGHVVHGVRFGKRVYPNSHCSLADSPVPVVSVDFSPFGQAYFLAGCDDGTLHLFNTQLENPIATWRGFVSGEKILHVRWSHSRPTVFFVLDNNSTVFTFDLVENGLHPVQADTITTASAISMEVGGDPHLLTPGSSRPAYMAFALSNGTTEVLTMSDDMRQQQPLEEAFMASYVDRY